jgi:hypothetical protein
MNINRVLATGLAYAFIGALILIASHRALYRKATRIIAGYPRVLAALRAQRYDGRFGLIILLCGNALQVLAACGYTVSPDHWRVPTVIAACALALYAIYRLASMRRIARPQSRESAARTEIRHMYETRRSMVLLDAARSEAATRLVREQAKGQRDRSVVYVAKDWDCRWWSDRLGVAPDVLRTTVRQVGPMVKDIERHLSSKNRRPYAVAA